MAADALPVQHGLLHSWQQAPWTSPRVILDFYGENCELRIAPVVHCDLSWHALHRWPHRCETPGRVEANPGCAYYYAA